LQTTSCDVLVHSFRSVANTREWCHIPVADRSSQPPAEISDRSGIHSLDVRVRAARLNLFGRDEGLQSIGAAVLANRISI
jgi:hypothetical protein